MISLLSTSERNEEGIDIMTMVSGFLDSHCLSWDFVEAFCTGSTNHIGKNSGFTAVIKKIKSNVINSY
jgi:hypothetical protein